jgi:hypothetical protein
VSVKFVPERVAGPEITEIVTGSPELAEGVVTAMGLVEKD